MSAGLQSWSPPSTFAETLKWYAIPPRLYMRQLVARHLKRGEPELRLLPDIVPKGRIAIDVGANKGVYTHVLAGLAAHVHAFEPNPKAYKWLVRALPANATAHPVALSDRDGPADLMIPKRGRGYSNQMASLHTGKRAEPHGIVNVHSLTLDSCALADVGFIKIDVEGHEMAVLAGGRQTIIRARPVLLIEMEERHTGRPLENDIATVERLGYETYYLDHGNLTPFSDLDVAGRHRTGPETPGYIYNFVFLPRL